MSNYTPISNYSTMKKFETVHKITLNNNSKLYIPINTSLDNIYPDLWSVIVSYVPCNDGKTIVGKMGCNYPGYKQRIITSDNLDDFIKYVRLYNIFYPLFDTTDLHNNRFNEVLYVSDNTYIGYDYNAPICIIYEDNCFKINISQYRGMSIKTSGQAPEYRKYCVYELDI